MPNLFFKENSEFLIWPDCHIYAIPRQHNKASILHIHIFHLLSFSRMPGPPKFVRPRPHLQGWCQGWLILCHLGWVIWSVHSKKTLVVFYLSLTVLDHLWHIMKDWSSLLLSLIVSPARGRGNSTVVSVSVCQAGRPGSRQAQSACFRKVEFYQVLFTWSHQCWWLVQQRPSMCYHGYVIMHVKDP